MFQLIFLIILVLIIKGFFYIQNFLRFLPLLNFYSVHAPTKLSDNKIIVLIPLLNEQKELPNLLRYFYNFSSDKRIQVYLVTTSKEKANLKDSQGNDLPTTYQLAQRLLPKYNNKAGREYFCLVNYPYQTGVMAHQLNYAVDSLSNDVDPENTFIVVYNADSQPNLRTFEMFDKVLLKNKSANPRVLQQVAIFFKNYQQYKNNVEGLILKASALIQTRWSLGYETNMIVSQSNFASKYRNKRMNIVTQLFEPISYCVGHGLFIRLDLLKHVGLFPQDTLNEDLPLGYYLSLYQEPIYLLPALEMGDNPVSVKGLIRQKSSWYWGMIDYFSYRKLVKNKIGNISKFRINLSTLKGLLRDAFAWAFMFPVLCILLFALIKAPSLGLLILFGLFMYTILPSLLVLLMVPRLGREAGYEKITIDAWDYLLVPLFTVIYLGISSFGPYLTLLNLVKHKLTGSQKVKFKTER